MCNFYEKLYSSNSISNVSIENYVENVENMCRLRDEDKQLCDLFPSLQECKDAVYDMKYNKSPGLDGIPNEFY